VKNLPYPQQVKTYYGSEDIDDIQSVAPIQKMNRIERISVNQALGFQERSKDIGVLFVLRKSSREADVSVY